MISRTLNICGFMSAIFISVSLASLSVFAEPYEAQSYIRVQSISPCSFWSYNSSPGGSGYLCSSYQSGVNVADGYATVQAIEALERRIEMLEQKLNAQATAPSSDNEPRE